MRSTRPSTRRRRGAPLGRAASALAALGVALVVPACEPAGPTTYYVDCKGGNDAAAGRGTATAWRTLAKANAAPLRAGDALRLRRGCTWTGRLDARWTGTAAKPVVVGSYGSGALPVLRNGQGSGVRVTGSYQVVEQLRAVHDDLPTDPGCRNQPVGYVVGFNLLDGAHHNVVRDGAASGNTAGVKLSYGAHHNQVLGNALHGNGVMQVLDPQRGPGHEDLGAWGVIVNGDDNEIAGNHLSGNNAWCTYDQGTAGNSVEVYAGRRNRIHHNTAVDDKVFSELGGSSDRKADGNVYAYNVVASNHPGARFIVTRGSGSTWGPVWRTSVFNNTVVLSAKDSEGVVCGAGCGPSILMLRGNLVWAQQKALYADGPLGEGGNLFWRTGGAPVIQLSGATLHPTSQVADPRFVDLARGDLRLAATSPALDRAGFAAVTAGYTRDIDGVSVPQRAGVDVGAHERPA